MNLDLLRKAAASWPKDLSPQQRRDYTRTAIRAAMRRPTTRLPGGITTVSEVEIDYLPVESDPAASPDGRLSWIFCEWLGPLDSSDPHFDVMMPFSVPLLVHNIWINIGADPLVGENAGNKLDLGFTVIRASDGFALGIFRDDHYTDPVGETAIRWKEPVSPPVLLPVGEILRYTIQNHGSESMLGFFACAVDGVAA